MARRPGVFDRLKAGIRSTIEQAELSGTTIFCRRCEEYLPAHRFDPAVASFVCTACRKLKLVDSQRADPFRYRIPGIEQRARTKGWAFDLTVEWAKARWVEQAGRCYYTQMPMTLFEDKRDPLCCSFDRADPKLGYLQSNTVLCCLCYNSFKGSMGQGQAALVFEAMVASTRAARAEWLKNPGVQKLLSDLRGLVDGVPVARGYVPATAAGSAD